MNNTERQMSQGLSVIREMTSRIHLPKSIEVFVFYFYLFFYFIFCFHFYFVFLFFVPFFSSILVLFCFYFFLFSSPFYFWEQSLFLVSTCFILLLDLLDKINQIKQIKTVDHLTIKIYVNHQLQPAYILFVKKPFK